MSELLHTAQQRDIHRMALERISQIVDSYRARDTGEAGRLLMDIRAVVKAAIGCEILLEVGANRE